MKKGYKIILIVAAVVFIVLAILYQTGTFNMSTIAPGEVAAPVEKNTGKVIMLHRQSVPIIYKSVGTVRSRDEIELSPRITARVIDITRRSGDSIKKGEVLVRLDDSDLLATKQRAQENLKAAEAVFQAMEKEYIRQKQLLAKDVSPRKTFEQAEEAWKTAQAGVNATAQALKVAEANLSYATIESPMDAIVSDRLDDPGDLASPGNIIMKIFDPKRLMLYVPVRESLVQRVKVGDKINFYVEALRKSYTGEVREIVPSVDTGSRTFLVKMCILGSTTGLMPGMFGTIALKLGTEQAFIVPENAIIRIGQLEYLTIVGKDGARSRIMVRTVPGPEPGTLRIIAGIDHDTEIVIER